jgi:outer membrane protein
MIFLSRYKVIKGMITFGLICCLLALAMGATAEQKTGKASGAGDAQNKFSASVPLSGPIKLTIGQAALLAFENNQGLLVERYEPAKQRTFEEQEQAAFDPVISMELNAERNQSRDQPNSSSTTTDTYSGEVSLSKFFPLGTFAQLNLNSRINDSSRSSRRSSSGLELELTQPLLKGYGRKVNLARLEQARIASDISHYEFRAFSESLLARVENAYWDHALAVRQVEIVHESLKVANQQLKKTQEMIRVGSMAESELPAAKAEVASQQQALINAKGDVETTRLSLLRLTNPPGKDLFSRKLVLVHPPKVSGIKMNRVEVHVANALAKRPEIKQAELRIKDGDLELVRTKNGLLPKLDFFIRLGGTGYSDSFAWPGDSDSDYGYNALAGMELKYPLYNREAKSKHQYALLDRKQTRESLKNLNQLVEFELRTAFVEVQRSHEQIKASSATRKLEEEKTRVETEKFRVGRSTTFAVSQAQRDLLAARINEVRALVNHLKAQVEFYLLEGTLLEKRGIVVSAK